LFYIIDEIYSWPFDVGGRVLSSTALEFCRKTRNWVATAMGVLDGTVESEIDVEISVQMTCSHLVMY
jgi:hypothetical protein